MCIGRSRLLGGGYDCGIVGVFRDLYDLDMMVSHMVACFFSLNDDSINAGC